MSSGRGAATATVDGKAKVNANVQPTRMRRIFREPSFPGKPSLRREALESIGRTVILCALGEDGDLNEPRDVTNAQRSTTSLPV